MDYLALIKSLHLITAVLWVGSLYALLHSMLYQRNSGPSKAMALYEIRLYRTIANPMMMAVFLMGIGMLVLHPQYMKQPWMHVKLTLLLLMLGIHMLTKRQMLAFHQGKSPSSKKTLWLIIGVLALLADIVVLAVFKDPLPWMLIGGFPLIIIALGAFVMKKI